MGVLDWLRPPISEPELRARTTVPDNGRGGGIKPQGLTASATRIEAPEREGIRRLLQAWQPLAMSYYDAIPEIHYCGNFYARAMQNVRFFVGERDENDEIVPSENEEAKALFARVHDPGGGRRLMMSRYGQMAFITGESLLMWSAETDDDEERWEVVSNQELQPNGSNGWVRFRAPGLGGSPVIATPDADWFPVPATSIVYRLWTPHPLYSWAADSPMRGVLDICKELLILTQAVNAMAISHAARAGMLLVPEELSFPPPEGGMDEDPDVDYFEQDLNRAMMAAIADPSSAAALAPMVVRGKMEYLHPDAFRHLSVQDEREKYPEENLRTECIRRIALGVDMPPEELLGKGTASHWNAWEISEDAWRHVEPVAWAFADSLSAAYLRPTARKEGIDGWERLCIGVDEGAAVVKPDRGNSANEVYDRGGINLEALRNAHEFTDDDAMDDDEYQTWLATKLGDPNELPEKWQQVDPASQRPSLPVTQQPPGAESADDKTGTAIPKGPPSTEGQTASLERMMGAAEMALVRCREKAGAKAKAAAQGCDPCRELVASVAPESVVATLGPDTCGDLGLDAVALCAGGADSFVSQAVRWGWPLKHAQALGEMLEMHAARNLFDGGAVGVPAGFAGHVRRGTID